MLYEMVVGVPPFDGDNPFVIMNARVTGDPEAPRKRNPKVSTACRGDYPARHGTRSGNRYQSAAAMKADLDNPGAVQLTGRCDRLQAPTPWKQSWKKVRWIVLGVSISLAIFLFVLWLIIHRGPAH